MPPLAIFADMNIFVFLGWPLSRVQQLIGPVVFQSQKISWSKNQLPLASVQTVCSQQQPSQILSGSSFSPPQFTTTEMDAAIVAGIKPPSLSQQVPSTPPPQQQPLSMATLLLSKSTLLSLNRTLPIRCIPFPCAHPSSRFPCPDRVLWRSVFSSGVYLMLRPPDNSFVP